MEAFWVLREKYDAMNFPNISFEESLTHSKAKAILANAMCWLLGGTETQLMRLHGLPTPNYPSSITETDGN
jgi:hypothetical protein